jgi:hypothetical protein
MPPDSPAAYTLVDKIRTTMRVIPGADAKVGGGSAINKDVESAAAISRRATVHGKSRCPAPRQVPDWHGPPPRGEREVALAWPLGQVTTRQITGAAVAAEMAAYRARTEQASLVRLLAERSLLDDLERRAVRMGGY